MIPTWLLSIAPYAICALLAGGASGYGVHRWDEAAIADLRASDAQARAAAIQAVSLAKDKQAASALAAAVAEAKAQAALNVKTVTLTKKVVKYVTPAEDVHAGCIPLSFVRLWVAADRGADPDSLSAPASEPPDACTAYSLSDVAASHVAAAGVSAQNSEQLNALEKSVMALHDAGEQK